MKKDGKPLEQAVKIIQEALKDKPDTEVFVNHKLVNKSDRKREFDVVVKSTINGMEIIIVVECKEYATKIPVEKIEAFNSKCLRVKGINKKIFVSIHGYQADAINAARDFDIDIYTLNDLNINEVEKWAMDIINYAKHLRFGFVFTKFKFVTEDCIREVDPAIFGLSNPEFIQFLYQNLLHNLNPILRSLQANIVNEIGLKFSNPITLVDKNDSSNDLILKEILISLIPTKDPMDFSTKIEEFKKDNDENSTAHVVTHEIEDGMMSKFVVTKDDIKIFHKNPQTGDFYDTGFKFTKEE